MDLDFAKIFEHVTVPLAIAEPEYPNNLLYVNRAFCDMTGYTKEELLGKNPGQMLQRNSIYADTRQFIRQRLNTHKDIDVLVQNYRKDNTPFWNELHIHPVIDEEGSCLYWVATQIDMTERINRVTTHLENFIAAVKSNFQQFKDDLSNI